jgi:hypothetical protein
MPNLTDNELRAAAYYAIGVSTEGSDIAYQLSFCGDTIHKPDGSVALEPIGNSGYTIGELQVDFGAQPNTAKALVDSFQTWSKTNHPDWVLSNQQAAQFASDLGRDGRHIRDPNYDADVKQYGRGHIPASHLPASGQDIDQTFKAHLNAYLASDAGKTFTHQEDVKQVDNLMSNVATHLEKTDLYKHATPDDQAKIFAVVAKAYNQGPAFADGILKGIDDKEITSLADINKRIDTFPDYMRTGRDAALSGAETFNALRNASEHNAIHDSWQAVSANPLVNPTQLGNDPAHPHLPEQYATVKGTFVQPAQGRTFVDALEKGGSYNYGDPSSSHSRGFYVEGKDFVQWDRNGHGRAFIGGQWSEFSRSELSLVHNADHTLDIHLTRNGQTQDLLHVTHPTGPVHAAPHHAEHHADGEVLHQGMHGDDVKKLQTQLGELGYLNNSGSPDGKFGTVTENAVKAFQHDHHLQADGKAGAGTEQAIQASLQPLKHDNPGSMPSASAGAPGADDPRNPVNPDHALFNDLKGRFPDASENRLMQFTAACHVNGINEQNLQKVHFDQQGGLVTFGSGGLMPDTATVDVKQPSPQPAQSIQQIQQFDQRQAHNQAQQSQQVQMNQQQGPAM